MPTPLLNPQEATVLGMAILLKGKMLAADRFPKPKPATARAWGEALSTRDNPPQLWLDAVTWWALNGVGERMCTPRDIVQAARCARAEWWLKDPVKARMLETRAMMRLAARDKAIAEGKDPFAADRQVRLSAGYPGGYRNPAIQTDLQALTAGDSG